MRRLSAVFGAGTLRRASARRRQHRLPLPVPGPARCLATGRRRGRRPGARRSRGVIDRADLSQVQEARSAAVALDVFIRIRGLVTAGPGFVLRARYLASSVAAAAVTGRGCGVGEAAASARVRP